MCGILGLYNTTSQVAFNKQNFQRALCCVSHRGPDARGIEKFSNKAILGHARLSIIDLHPESNQPFEIEGRYWVAFNGEIFNYLELRDELKQCGHMFRTQSDTEVLLRSYLQWGEDCVNHFNGMWSFAIYDQSENKMFCSRDRFGVKPFNYAYVDGQIIFASEIKAILSYFPSLKVPNYNVIANYCRNSIGAQIEETWFKDIYRLPSAHNMVITNEGIRKYRYWNYPRKVNFKISFDEACNSYRKLLTDSVRLRMRSDVPVGFTLSSGIDSTAIVCLLKNQFEGNRTYTASFDESGRKNNENTNFKTKVNIDEPKLVKRLTSELGFSPDIVEVNFDHYVADLQKIIFHLESGHGSPAVFPLDKILNEATKEVTVVLEGQGADELLGGYISNVEPIYIKELIKKLKFKKAFAELKTFTHNYSAKSALMLMIRHSNLGVVKKAFYQFSGINDMFTGSLKKFKWINDYPEQPTGFDTKLNEHLFKSHSGGLINLLHYGDAISMKHSLESRLPFMDYRLVEFAFTLPTEFKVHHGMGKYIHRKAMEGIVPEYILKNKLKFGFDSPLAAIFSETGSGSARSVLLSEKCLSRGLFSKTKLEKCFNKHKEGHENNARLLYRMLSVELWFRDFIDEPNS